MSYALVAFGGLRSTVGHGCRLEKEKGSLVHAANGPIVTNSTPIIISKTIWKGLDGRKEKYETS